MKKLIALLMVLSLLFCCVACQSSPDTDTPTDEVTKKVTSEVTAAASQQPQETATPQPVKKTLSRGFINEDVYKSDYTDITFTKPSDWTYYSDAEIASVMNAGIEALDYDKFTESAAKMMTIYDMMVMDHATGNNVSVCYENLTLSNSTKITLPQYLAAVKNQLASQDLVQVEFSEEALVTLSGEEYLRAIATTQANGVTMTQVYYMRKMDTYMCNIVATLTQGYTVADLEKMFS